MEKWTRRDFLEFMGQSVAFSAGLSSLSSCSALDHRYARFKKLKPLRPTKKDDLVLSDGFSYQKIISWGDSINPKETFGFNNDFITYVELKSGEILLWVNHEYSNPLFVSSSERTRENIVKEMKSVGGSIIQLNQKNGHWFFQKNSKFNKRIDALTSIPFSNGIEIKGKAEARGTLANCSGGKTPWGTILTAEENYEYCYGDREHGETKITPSYHGWEKEFFSPPEHYGWIVEVDPLSGQAQKRVEMGRFSHESATVVSHPNGVVVYSGDDKSGEHVYKFVSESNTNLDKGTLYVANMREGRWIPLDYEKHKSLRRDFKDQIEVLTYTRKASKYVGATPLPRPEDIEIHPLTGDVFVALTGDNNQPFGSLLRIRERDGDYHSLHFSAETFTTGGTHTGFSSPDNIAFDKLGNLWFCSDILTSKMNKGPYKPFGNNGLFVIPFSGSHEGKVFQVGSAPSDAELTGLCFDPDGNRLFVSVQHPGEGTTNLKRPTSLWPFDGSQVPKPSVVEIKSFLF